jgi:hypothetical protein
MFFEFHWIPVEGEETLHNGADLLSEGSGKDGAISGLK